MLWRQKRDRFRSNFQTFAGDAVDRFLIFAAAAEPSGNALLEDWTDILLEDATNLLLEW